MGKTRSEFRILVGKLEGNRIAGWNRCRDLFVIASVRPTTLTTSTITQRKGRE
jgi:hypothetical protein